MATSMAVAMTEEVANESVDEETYATSKNADNAIWTITPPKGAE
jgi:hypothetical protein